MWSGLRSMELLYCVCGLCGCVEKKYGTRQSQIHNTWLGHVTNMDVSRHTHGWITSHIWIGHVPNTLYLDCECAMKKKLEKIKCKLKFLDQKPKSGKRTWKPIFWSKNAGTRFLSKTVSPHEYNLVTSHVWMSHVTRRMESCHTFERAGYTRHACKETLSVQQTCRKKIEKRGKQNESSHT